MKASTALFVVGLGDDTRLVVDAATRVIVGCRG